MQSADSQSANMSVSIEAKRLRISSLRVNSCITAATSRQSCATGMCSLYTL